MATGVEQGAARTGPHGGAYRPPAMGANGMVASAHGLASLAGVRALMDGGNAVDAAVAVAATLAVVEPFMSGLGGGGGFMMIRDGATGKVWALDYMGSAPRAARADVFTDQEQLYSDVRAAVVPGSIGGWRAAHHRFGRLPWASLFQFAIQTAERGWPVSHFAAATLDAQQERLGRFEDTRRVLYPNGRPPRAGELVPMPELARSLRAVAEGGPDAFYQGQLGERFVRAVQEEGGWLTIEDLGSFGVTWREPLGVTYRGYRVETVPPPCSGVQYLESLAILEGFDLPALKHNSPEYLHLLLETIKVASADRAAHTMSRLVPMASLLAPEYVAERRALIDRSRAAPSEGERFHADKAGLVAPGDPSRYRRDHTTHFEAADRDGSLVSVTQSNGGVFGCGLIAGDTGIPLNNFLYWNDLDPRSPNHLAPGATMENPMSPCIVSRDGRAVLGIGTPGSYGILQTTLQMLLNRLDFGMNVQAAIEAPRVRAFERTLVDVESRVPAVTLEALRVLGHEPRVLPDFTMQVGGGHGIAIDPETGVMTGGADPRRDGAAIGW